MSDTNVSDLLTSKQHQKADAQEYNDEFTFIEGSDIVLLSSDGVEFHTHSFVLRTASKVFRTTLSLPQAAGTYQKEGVIGPLPEDAQTIRAVLRMISGMELPALDTFEEVEKVLTAAYKWDMPGPISVFHRMGIPSSLLEEPLRLYGMACRFGWTETAKIASTHTLDLDLRETKYRQSLCGLETKDLLQLQELRTERRDKLLDFLKSYPPPHSGHQRKHNIRGSYNDGLDGVPGAWEALKLKVFTAMDARPSGQSLFAPQAVIQAELQEIRSTCCSSCQFA